jgi:hypothetical protein
LADNFFSYRNFGNNQEMPMSPETLLISGMAASALTSGLMWAWPRQPLRSMLGRLCDADGSQDFWVRYALLMLVIAPLAVVAVLSPHEVGASVEALRRLLLAVLLGHLVGLALVGRSLMNAIRREQRRQDRHRTPTRP